MNPPRLLCLGNLTIDDVVLPTGVEQAGCMGGDALYAALAGRLFEPAVEMVAPLGRDFPTDTMTRIAAAGLSPAGLVTHDVPTLRNRVVYDAWGGRRWTCFFEEAAFDALSPDAVDIPAHYREAHGVLVLAMTLPGQERLVDWACRDTQALVALDPQEDYIAGQVERLKRLIGRTDIFLPSAEEVRRLLGHEDWPAAARTFAAIGPRTVVIKLGPDGAIAYQRDADAFLRCAPSPSARPLDTTGAGDAFCGALMARLLRSPDRLDEALRAGTAAAAIAIGGFGVEPLFAASRDAAARLARDVEVTRGP